MTRRRPIGLRLTTEGWTLQGRWPERPLRAAMTGDPLEFLARVRMHIADKGKVTTRSYGWHTHCPCWMRRQAEPTTAERHG